MNGWCSTISWIVIHSHHLNDNLPQESKIITQNTLIWAKMELKSHEIDDF